MLASHRELNARQREAASFGDGALRVIAGPGTGKTTTLTARVDILLERGVAPERILLLTFTRRSSREIVSRVRALRGAAQGRRVSGGTFHSVATPRFAATTPPSVYPKDSVFSITAMRRT
jgi:DNA helicase-2/ATP-dependent DNA helicase PcrA